MKSSSLHSVQLLVLSSSSILYVCDCTVYAELKTGGLCHLGCRRHPRGHGQAASRRGRGGEGRVGPTVANRDHRRPGAEDRHAGHQAIPEGGHTRRWVESMKK